MAQATGNNVLRIAPDSQRALVQYLKIVLDLHKRMSEYRDKLEFIDIAYARYKTEQELTPGTDNSGAASVACGVNVNDITVPIVISEVDSYVGYFSDIYLSGFPMFPVVSRFDNRESAEKLESIIDDHSIRGRYPRHMLMAFRDAAKYNISCLDVSWDPLNIYNVAENIAQLSSTGEKNGSQAQNKLELSKFHHNAVTRSDMYNTFWDYRVLPVDVPYKAEYAGNIEICSRIELKRKLAYYGASGDGYNTTQALTKGNFGKNSADVAGFGYYTDQPDISKLVSKKDLHSLGLFDWVSYFSGEKQKGKGAKIAQMSDVYEHIKIYVRLIPNEFGMQNVPNAGTPQVWKLCFVNHETLVYAKRMYTLYDMIPMFFSQPFEDGFGMQTQSIAENSIPFQKAASDLFSIRMNSARRAVVDRAIYDPSALNSADVNAPYASAKIPLRDGQSLIGKKLEDVYKAIPFDSRGTETVIQDMGAMISMADRMNGVNQAIQGQPIKGNKSVKEWDDTQQGAKNRMRLPALAIEYQQILPVKETIKLNLYQYGVEGTFNDNRNGKSYEIDRKEMEKIRENVGNFKLADGFQPSEQLTSSDVLVEGMKFISQSPILQQGLGAMLPQMFVHFMSLGGVKGLEQYLPQQPPGVALPAAAPAPVTPQNAGIPQAGPAAPVGA